MGLLSKLFGGASDKGAKSKVEPQEHKGFLIYPEPKRAEGGYRIGARIEKEVGGEMRSHTMVRADTLASEDEASAASVHKAQIFIDQMGEGIFG
ncbi:HlyU family transcriptional regulator [Celeribacter arenosi]|uniref:HlyU family transcriptional regulator n=1 Tax=Celeribacter arenosi TaxID=792649 RepID=A0ABP7JT53_9RHOB